MWFFDYISYKYGLNSIYFISRSLFIAIYFIYLYYFHLFTKDATSEATLLCSIPIYIIANYSTNIVCDVSIKEKVDSYIALILVALFNLYMMNRMNII